MDVSILILTKNEERNISKCLKQIFSQRTQFCYEVIVIDSGSTDKTVEICKKFPVKCFSIKPKQFSHSRTRNLAAKMSKGKYLAYIAGDAIPCNEYWLDNLIKSLLEHDAIGAVYGRQVPKGNLSPIHKFRLNWLYNDKRLIKDYSQRNNLRKFYFFSTVNCAIKRKIWKEFSFNEELQIFEDVELAYRLMRSGYRIIYEPNARVYHGHNIGILDTFRRYFVVGTTLSYSGISDDLKKGFGGEGITYILREILYLLSKGYFYLLPYAIIHDVAKSVGLLLGIKEHWFLRDLNRYLLYSREKQ